MSDNKHSITVVAQRVQKTKKEIEDLKAELQKLITCGIKKVENYEEHTKKTDEANQLLITSIKQESPKKNNMQTKKEVNNVNTNTDLKATKSNKNIDSRKSISNVTIRKNLNSLKENTMNNDLITTTNNKKVKPYDPEEVREYIKRKRKERALERKSAVKTNDVVGEVVKKERLRELHKESLDLVTKNVQMKRDRSRSREPNRNLMTCINFKRGTSQANDKQAKDTLTEGGTTGIDEGRLRIEDAKVKASEEEERKKKRDAAAVKIQSLYRGHMARMSYKRTLADRKAIAERTSKKTTIDEHIWLNDVATPMNPYNFINTVKRKLNLAVRESPIDVAPKQDNVHSHRETVDGSSMIRKTKETIMMLIERSNNNIVVQSESSESVNVPTDSDTSKNVPDIVTEGSSTTSAVSLLHDDPVDNMLRRSACSRDSIISSNRCDYGKLTGPLFHNRSDDNEYVREFIDYMRDFGATPQQPETVDEAAMKSDSQNRVAKTPTCEDNVNVVENKSSASTNDRLEEVETEEIQSLTNSSSTVKIDWTQSPTSLVVPSVKLSVATASDYDSRRKTSQANGDGGAGEMMATEENTKDEKEERKETKKRMVKRLILKEGETTSLETVASTNQIHLKFEAELHLLNDFNESLRQFMAVDKSLVELQNKNSSRLILHTRDTQTSIGSRSTTSDRKTEPVEEDDFQLKIEDDLNLEVPSSLSLFSESNRKTNAAANITSIFSNRTNSSSTNYMNILNNDSLATMASSTVTTSNDSSEAIESSRLTVAVSKETKGEELPLARNIDIDLFDRFIKDEDARLDNLKTILRIREKTLLDRTKAELAWLEIQKKHLKETGHAQQASLVKKKQRGILLKLQQERHEMQRLKQMQKAASKERKIMLKQQQRDLIKGQLATDHMMTTRKIKRRSQQQQPQHHHQQQHVENQRRRSSGPLKVYNIRTSETSIISKQSNGYISSSNNNINNNNNSSMTEEIISVTSTRTRSLATAAINSSHSDDNDVYSNNIKGVISVDDEKELQFLMDDDKENKENGSVVIKDTDQIKRSLSMREEALRRRRKAAEELLEWHRRLLEEEARIRALEMTASKIIEEVSTANRNRTDSLALRLDALPSKLTLNEEAASASTSSTSRREEIQEEESNNRDEATITSEPIGSFVSNDSSSVHLRSSINLNGQDNTMECVTSSLHQIKATLSNISHEISEIQELSIAKTETKEISEEEDDAVKEKTSSSEEEERKETIESRGSVKSLELDLMVEEHGVESFESIDRHSNISENFENRASDSASELTEIVEEHEETNRSVQQEIIENKATSNDETQQELSLSETGFEHEEETKEVLQKLATLSITHEEVDTQTEIEEEVLQRSREEESATNAESFDDEYETNSYEERQQRETSVKEQTAEETFNDPLITEASLNKSLYDAAVDTEEVTFDDILEINEESSNKTIDSQSQQVEDVVSREPTESHTKDEVVEVLTSSPDSRKEVDEKPSSTSSSPSTTKSPECRSLDELRSDVRKRVTELLIDGRYKSENSPRLQDIYCTTYDLNGDRDLSPPEPISTPPSSSSSTTSDSSKSKEILSAKFGDEAEELLKKQLAIEQEIKQLEQQQKEQQLPYIYVREIPNKPPPPYTPPAANAAPTSTNSSASTSPSSAPPSTVLPSDPAKLDPLIDRIGDILYEANRSNRLHSVEFDDEQREPIVGLTRTCQLLIFDLAKEIATEHYALTEDERGARRQPSWMVEPRKRHEYAFRKPFDRDALRSYIKSGVQRVLIIDDGCAKLKEETDGDGGRRWSSALTKWSHKKRDHVDELLVVESQNEEAEWTSYERDEIIVKNDLTNEIMRMLIDDTADALSVALRRKAKI